MFLHRFFFKQTMAFLGIAFNKGGVQCFCISLFWKNTMAFLEIAFNSGGVQCSQSLRSPSSVLKKKDAETLHATAVKRNFKNAIVC